MERGVGLGVLVGLVVIALLGWVPVIGPFIAGYLAGLHSRQRREGAAVGFAIGAIGSLVMTLLFYILPSQVFIVTVGLFSGLIGMAFTSFYSLGPLVLTADTVLFAVIGGALGARLRGRRR